MKRIYLIAIILLAFSVYMGCKKDDNNDNWFNACPGTPVVTYEGQVYKTVLIGDQCWMAENLNIGTMINGTNDMTDDGVIEKYCYDNDPANCDEYGGLYQWNEMMEYNTTAGVQGICLKGWHLPTDEEWTIISDFFFEGGQFLGGKLKEIGTTHWKPPNAGATNESGFTALPSGNRISDGFVDLGSSVYYWSSSEYNSNRAKSWGLYYNMPYLGPSSGANKIRGFSVRCLKNLKFDI
jgi:uncharacterized protein (TIGR02145 family)